MILTTWAWDVTFYSNKAGWHLGDVNVPVKGNTCLLYRLIINYRKQAAYNSSKHTILLEWLYIDYTTHDIEMIIYY